MQEKDLNDLGAAELGGRFAENCDIYTAIESGRLRTLDDVLRALEVRNDRISKQLLNAGVLTPRHGEAADRVTRGQSTSTRALSACLDAGMMLMIGGAISGTASALEIIDSGYVDSAAAALLIGLAVYAIAARLARNHPDA